MDFLKSSQSGAAGRVVNRWLALLFVALTVPASAADWQDKLTPLKPRDFPLPRPQTGVYRFGWGAISAAEAVVSFSSPEKGVHEVKMTAKTIGAARALWQMDVQHTARCSSDTLLPMWFQQTEKYRNTVEKRKADFTPKEVVRLEEIVPSSKKLKPKGYKFANLADMHTALLLVRSQELKDGDQYSVVVFPDHAAYLARVDVIGRESIKVAGKTSKAVKLKLSLQRISKKRELEPHKKFKNAHAWVSDDKDRLFLKIESEVFVGSVWMELQSVKFDDE